MDRESAQIIADAISELSTSIDGVARAIEYQDNSSIASAIESLATSVDSLGAFEDAKSNEISVYLNGWKHGAPIEHREV